MFEYFFPAALHLPAPICTYCSRKMPSWHSSVSDLLFCKSHIVICLGLFFCFASVYSLRKHVCHGRYVLGLRPHLLFFTHTCLIGWLGINILLKIMFFLNFQVFPYPVLLVKSPKPSWWSLLEQWMINLSKLKEIIFYSWCPEMLGWWGFKKR